MEARILKTISPFLFAALMILASLSAIAQRGDRNQGNRDITGGDNRVVVQRTTPSNQVRFANRSVAIRNSNARANINVSFGKNRILPTSCGPAFRARPVRRNYNYNAVVRFLPQNSIRFKGMNRDYFFARGQFYTATNRGYLAIVAPVGVRLSYLPTRAVQVIYNRNICYQLGNVLLAPIVTRRGSVAYELAGYV